MPDNNLFDEEVGLLKTGAITGYDSRRDVLKVRLSGTSALNGQNSLMIDVPAPHSLFYNNGLFIGTLPATGTPVVVGQGPGGQHYFVSFLAENLAAVPDLTLGELLIRTNNNTKISLDANNINIGSNNNKIHIDTKVNSITTSFNSENHFTQGARIVEGIIKRDLKPNINFSQNSKLENDDYYPYLFSIGLDPSVGSNSIISGSTKNPPFVEQREMIYEFQSSSNVQDDLSESALYNNSAPESKNFTYPNRRKSRSDTLSLTLSAPNYLMETIKGTVVDIFGNILDLNRAALPIGQDQNTINSDASTDKSKSYQLIKELERKSLAFHFELNARKDLSSKNGLVLPDINSNDDYSRNRSRFFIDIDKEGQFKLNVPASSEKGNISLLTRYENYSTFSTDDNGNPNKLIFNADNLDIYQDSFASSLFSVDDQTFIKGSIKLDSSGAEGAPLDRITKAHIKHGTAYHDILNTCYAHQSSSFINFVADPQNPVFSSDVIGNIPTIGDIVSKTINISGDNANAGGRSGSINFDGSLDLNIGANTVDRQSLWADLAGGLVANIGRDLKNKSGAITMDGDLFMQIGGMGVSTDSRFIKQNNGQMGAVLDIRVFNDGLRVTMIRVDKDGVKILTPGNMAIHSAGDMRITSDSDIAIECESLTLQGRFVKKEFGGAL